MTCHSDAPCSTSAQCLPAVAVSTTGVGEAIMRCMLASSAAQLLLQQQADRPADEVLGELLRRKLHTQAQPNDAGLLAVRVERAGEVRRHVHGVEG